MVSFGLLYLAAFVIISSAFEIKRTDHYEVYLDEGKPRQGIPEINIGHFALGRTGAFRAYWSVKLLSHPATGKKLFEGDILFPLEKNALKNTSYRWNIPVPFIMGNTIDLNTKGVILQAFEMFRLKSCIDFKPYEGEKSYLLFEKLDGCWSYVGDFQSGQTVSIGERCEYKDTVEHEILHALGFYHEQSRTDRDDYVNIWWEEIIPENCEKAIIGFVHCPFYQYSPLDMSQDCHQREYHPQHSQEHNFNKYNDSIISDLNTPYDYESVMHYGPYSFNKNSSIPTVTTKIPEFNDVIGQSQDLSRIDLQRLNHMYNCASSLTLLDQCSFEVINICGMVQGMKDDADWEHTLISTRGQSKNVVGPCADKGSSMYFKTTAGSSGDSAVLESRILYPRRNEKCLQFYYKFDGSPQDQLVVWIKSDDGTGAVRKTAKLQTISAGSEQHWNLASVPFNSRNKFRYVFQGIKGDPSNSTGGITIDDITLTETRCPASIWQIRNFTSLFSSTSKGDYVASPIFYSSEGYCFVLKLFPHGPVSSTNENYLGIMFALCSGQNDGVLEWPAGNRQVTFIIVDQDPDVTQRMSSSRSFVTDPNQQDNNTLIWDNPLTTGSFDPLYDRFVGPMFGWRYILPYNYLLRRHFLKNDNLLIFADFEVVEDPGSVL